MSWNDRRPYENATAITQDLLNACADNLVFRIETVLDLETPTGYIRASDRNKYIGATYYTARMEIPSIKRTIGEWLAPNLEFSTIQVSVSNVDELYNNLLPSGANYSSWIGKNLEIRSGLASIASSYRPVFKGFVTEIGGFQRDIKAITVIARDEFDRLNLKFPVAIYSRADFPKIGGDIEGKLSPVIYGDWTVELDPYPAVVPTSIVNGGDPFVDGRDRNVELVIASPGLCYAANHGLDSGDPIHFVTNGSLPSPLVVDTTYYVLKVDENVFGVESSLGGGAITFTGSQSGQHRYKADPTAPRVAVQCAITMDSLPYFDHTQLYLKRSDGFFQVPVSEISGLVAQNNRFSIAQKSGVPWIDGAEFEYSSGDIFCVRVKGKSLSGYDDNPVWIARDILKTYGRALDSDFHSNWATYRDKASPSQSAIASIKARVYEVDLQEAMQYALSILEQIRLEAFIDIDRKIKINSMHFEDWPASPSLAIQQWDIETDKISPRIDDRNIFNRVVGDFNFSPILKANMRQTNVLRNNASITALGKEISKKIVFPNLYQGEHVEAQLTEILRLASAASELIEISVSPKVMLHDLGDWLRLNVIIGSSQFANVPVMIREIQQDQTGLRYSLKVWSMQLVPFPSWVPSYSGIIGGYNATITIE